MEAGRLRNIETRMKGNVNLDNKLTDLYLPRKCDYTDKLITPKDNASIQLNICDLNEDGTINLGKSSVVTICGFVRSVGESDTALDKVLREKRLVWYNDVLVYHSLLTSFSLSRCKLHINILFSPLNFVNYSAPFFWFDWQSLLLIVIFDLEFIGKQ